MPNAKGLAPTVDAYAEALPLQARSHFEAIRAVVRAAAPELDETISYQIPAFKLQGSVLIYAAAWTKHVAIYPVYDSEWEKVPGLLTCKGTRNSLHFSLSKPLPLDLIQAFVEFKIKESRRRSA